MTLSGQRTTEKSVVGFGGVGRKNILKVSILSDFPQTLKNRPESRNFKVTFKFLKLSPPKPHYIQLCPQQDDVKEL